MANGFSITPITPAVTAATAVSPAPPASQTAAAAAVNAAANAQAVNTAVPAQAILVPGQTVTAQVSQVLDNGAVRLTTPAGTVDIKPSVPLQVGIAVVIQVPQGNAPLKLTLPPSIAPVNATASATVVSAGVNNNQRFTATANAINAQSASFLAEMVAAHSAGRVAGTAKMPLPELPKVQIPQQVSEVVRQVIGQAVTAAVTRQDSMLPLFSSLKHAVAHFSPPMDLMRTTALPTAAAPSAPVNPLVESLFPHRAQHMVEGLRLQGQSQDPGQSPGQGGLTPAPALSGNTPVFPHSVLQAAERVIAAQIPLGQTVSAADVRMALAQSGLFVSPNAVQPSGAGALPVSATPTVDTALKLLGFPTLNTMPSPAAIEKALTGLVEQQAARNAAPPPPIPSGGVPAVDSSIARTPLTLAGGGSPMVVDAVARLMGITLPAGAPVTLDMLKQAVMRASGSSGSAAKPVADFSAKPALNLSAAGAGLPLPATNLKNALSGLRHALVQWMGSGVEAIQAVSAVARRPSPPRPVGNPVAQAGNDMSSVKDMSLQQLGAKMLAQTEAALARQGLLQWASLPEGAERGMGRADGVGQPVIFEAPVLMNGQNAIIQFHIEQDAGDGNSDDKDGKGKSWQAKFAVSFEPLGAVHAHVTLRGDVANVSLWAERAEAAEILQANMLDLRDALAGANFEVHDLNCRAGKPNEAPAHNGNKAASGYFLDQKT